MSGILRYLYLPISRGRFNRAQAFRGLDACPTDVRRSRCARVGKGKVDELKNQQFPMVFGSHRPIQFSNSRLSSSLSQRVSPLPQPREARCGTNHPRAARRAEAPRLLRVCYLCRDAGTTLRPSSRCARTASSKVLRCAFRGSFRGFVFTALARDDSVLCSSIACALSVRFSEPKAFGRVYLLCVRSRTERSTFRRSL